MSREKILDIEVLRGLAVIGVVIHHARDNLFTWTSPGLERLAPAPLRLAVAVTDAAGRCGVS